MPAEIGYKGQVGPAPAKRAVLASAASFGAGVAGAVGDAAADVNRLQLRSYQLDRKEKADGEAAEVARRSAEFRLEMDEFTRAARNDAKPGAADHSLTIKEALADRKLKLTEGITEDAVRRSAEAGWTDFSVRVESGEADWQEGKRIAHDVGNVQRAGEVGDNRITHSGGDNKVYEEELVQGYAAIDAMDIDDDTKEDLKLEHEQGRTLSWLKARSATDPAAVKLEMAAGIYDTMLTQKQIAAIDREADLEIKAQANEAAIAEQEARVKARNDLETIEARIERGEDVPQKDTAAAVANARAAGIVEADLIRFGIKADDAKILRSYSAANDPEGARSSAAVAEIDEAIRNGTATPEQYRMRDKLAGYADSRAVDAGERLAEMAGQGLGGQEAALAEIDKLPGATRFKAAEKLGNNMGYVAMAKPQTRKAILAGLADIGANKDLVDAKEFETQFRASLGSAANGMSESAIEGRMQAAMGYYAHYAKAKGAKADAINPGIFNAAMKVSFGGEQKNGAWVGGVATVRQKAVRLPDGYTASLFDTRMSRMTFADAVYRDGSAVAKADVLANFTPVFVGNTPKGDARYHFVDANGAELKMKNGKPFPMVMD